MPVRIELAGRRGVIHLAIFHLEAGAEQEFTGWYHGDHVPRVLDRPGWRRMRAYRCLDGQPFVSIYEVDDGLPTEPYLSAAPFRSGGRFAARGMRDYSARTWREIHAAGDSTRRAIIWTRPSGSTW